ncbi:hypothetical protein H5410_004538 [Solanum commersonii]|uniref:Uncharacterized protein n=1 Tax=Solanum commersonii TaxID=4109 RepID=A0A9J6B7M6_SOLCO|nr:hypothetical protein H5410_004538 [Solanum commersonii]
MPSFDGLSKIFSIDFPVAHQEKSDDQKKINQQELSMKCCKRNSMINEHGISMARSQSKFQIQTSKKHKYYAKALNLNASSSSSKRAKRSKVDAFSISPTTPTLGIESNNEMIDVVVKNKGDGEEEENVYDSIFMGFEELQGVFASIL